MKKGACIVAALPIINLEDKHTFNSSTIAGTTVIDYKQSALTGKVNVDLLLDLYNNRLDASVFEITVVKQLLDHVICKITLP